MSEEKQRIKLLLLVIARPIFWGDNYVEGPKSRKKISFFSELILTKRSPTSVHNIKKKRKGKIPYDFTEFHLPKYI